jgi:hypothetical protein
MTWNRILETGERFTPFSGSKNEPLLTDGLISPGNMIRLITLKLNSVIIGTAHVIILTQETISD